MPNVEFMRHIPQWDNEAIPSRQRNIFPEFFKQPRLQKTEKGGQEWHDVEMIRIVIGGDTKNMVERKAHDGDRRRFAQAYDAFKRDEDAPVDGTPLDMWAVLKPAQRMQLKALEIRTVEALAELRDSALQDIMGGRQLQAKARAFLEAQEKAGAAQVYADRAEQLEGQLAAMQDQIAQVQQFADQNAKLQQQIHELTEQNAALHLENETLKPKKRPARAAKEQAGT